MSHSSSFSEYLPGDLVCAASELASCIREGMRSRSASPPCLPVGPYYQIAKFFTELVTSMSGKSPVFSDAYRLGLRVLGTCTDVPLINNGLNSRGDVEKFLFTLAHRFSIMEKDTTCSTPEEVAEVMRLAAFLERLCFIDERDKEAEARGRSLAGRKLAIH